MARAARLATEHAPGLVAEALADPGEDAVMADGCDHALQPEPAAPGTGPAGILDQAIGLHQQRILHLDRFHR